MNRQKFKYRLVFGHKKKQATALTWLLGKSELIEKKWHEESKVNLKIIKILKILGIFVVKKCYPML